MTKVMTGSLRSRYADHHEECFRFSSRTDKFHRSIASPGFGLFGMEQGYRLLSDNPAKELAVSCARMAGMKTSSTKMLENRGRSRLRSGYLPRLCLESVADTTKKRSSFLNSFRAPPGARTLDPNIKSVVLYQLS